MQRRAHHQLIWFLSAHPSFVCHIILHLIMMMMMMMICHLMTVIHDNHHQLIWLSSYLISLLFAIELCHLTLPLVRMMITINVYWFSSYIIFLLF